MALILSCNHTLCYWYICFLSHKVRENDIKYHSFKNLTLIIFVRFLPFNGQFFVWELLNCDHHFLLNSLFKLEIQFISILWHRAKRIETSFSRYRTWTVKYTKEFTFSKFSINSKFIRFKNNPKKRPLDCIYSRNLAWLKFLTDFLLSFPFAHLHWAPLKETM